MINTRPMVLAKKISASGIGRVKIGAVLVCGKNVFSGFNNALKTHPVISKNSYRKIHAETSCLIGKNRTALIGGTIYVYREDREGRIANSKPCPSCQAILKVFGVERCYYTNPQEIGNVGMIDLRRD
jgi:tRNA(Arg) A34 adenosine deaminase TadA